MADRGRDVYTEALPRLTEVIRVSLEFDSVHDQIVELCRRYGIGLQERHPEIPWRRVADFRNVAVHECFSVDWSLVWRLVQDRLPMLRPQIMKVIKVEFPDIGERFDEGRQ